MKRSVLLMVLLAWPAASHAGLGRHGQLCRRRDLHRRSPRSAPSSRDHGLGSGDILLRQFADGLGLSLMMNAISMSGTASNWTLTPDLGIRIPRSQVGYDDGGDYFATFDSIMPDGQVVGGYAVADFETLLFRGWARTP